MLTVAAMEFMWSPSVVFVINEWVSGVILCFSDAKFERQVTPRRAAKIDRALRGDHISTTDGRGNNGDGASKKFRKPFAWE